MTLVTALLMLQDIDTSGGGFLVAANLGLLGGQTDNNAVFHTGVGIDRERWTGIVIHHSGKPAGDPESVTRRHLSMGLQGLGYHFLIGNGNGLGDGVVHVGYRWDDQLPGAHVAGPAGLTHNQHSIGICLIGNGDRREFTEAQMTQLITLIRRLQQKLRIPADQVSLHRDLASGVSSPGRFFSAARLQEQMLDLPR